MENRKSNYLTDYILVDNEKVSNFERVITLKIKVKKDEYITINIVLLREFTKSEIDELISDFMNINYYSYGTYDYFVR